MHSITNISPRTMKLTRFGLCVAIVVSLCAAMFTTFLFNQQYIEAHKELQTSINKNQNFVRHHIQPLLDANQHIYQSIEAATKRRVSPQRLEDIMTNALQEHHMINSIVVTTPMNSGRQWQSFSVQRDKIHHIIRSHTISQDRGDIEHGHDSKWQLDPTHEALPWKKNLVYRHALPHRSMLTITIDKQYFTDLLSTIDHHRHHQSAFINRNGRVLSHDERNTYHKGFHKSSYATDSSKHLQKKLAQLDQSKNNHIEYLTKYEKEKYWIFIHRIDGAYLMLMQRINTDKLPDLNKELERKKTWIVVFSSFAVICGVYLYCTHRFQEAAKLSLIARALVFVFAAGCTVFALQTHVNNNLSFSSQIESMDSEEKLLDFEQKHFTGKTLIPTGIEIGQISEQKNNQTYRMTATIWQKLPLDWPAQQPELQIANSETLLQSKLLFNHVKNNSRHVAWKVVFTIKHHGSMHLYPFDQTLVKVTLLPRRLNENIQLVPDITSYPKIMTDHTIAVAPGVKMGEQTIHDSYFSFVKYFERDATLGSQTFYASNPYIMQLNIECTRDLSKAIFSYFVPLAMVFLVCYTMCFLIDTQKKGAIGTSIGIGASLLFVVVLVQNRFHTNFSTTMITFMDILLLYCYVLIISIITMAVQYAKNIALEYTENHKGHIIKQLYWPLNAVIILIITLIFFAI